MKKTTITLLAVMALAGCGGPDSGKVTDRSHTDAWTETRMTCMARDKNGLCTMNVPQPVYHPETCALYLENEAGEKGWTSVTCAEYGQYAMWEQYP